MNRDTLNSLLGIGAGLAAGAWSGRARSGAHPFAGTVVGAGVGAVAGHFTASIVNSLRQMAADSGVPDEGVAEVEAEAERAIALAGAVGFVQGLGLAIAVGSAAVEVIGREQLDTILSDDCKPEQFLSVLEKHKWQLVGGVERNLASAYEQVNSRLPEALPLDHREDARQFAESFNRTLARFHERYPYR